MRLDWEKANAKEKARPEPTTPPTSAWHWIRARFNSTCDCGNRWKKGDVIAYSHLAKKALCRDCGEAHHPRAGRRL